MPFLSWTYFIFNFLVCLFFAYWSTMHFFPYCVIVLHLTCNFGLIILKYWIIWVASLDIISQSGIETKLSVVSFVLHIDYNIFKSFFFILGKNLIFCCLHHFNCFESKFLSSISVTQGITHLYIFIHFHLKKWVWEVGGGGGGERWGNGWKVLKRTNFLHSML